MGFGYLLEKDVGRLPNGLVVVNMAEGGDEIADVELLFKLNVEGFRFRKQHHIDVHFLLADFGENFVYVVEVVGVDGCLQFGLVLLNECSTSVATADKTLLVLAGFRFVDPVPARAQFAKEALARLTEVPDVFKVEHRLATDCSLASFSVHGFLNELPG